MAYIARLRTLQKVGPASSATALVSSRGDKWYIDPEECRQYNSPFFTKYSGGFPPTWGPDAESQMQNKNSTYPRMPFYNRQLKNPHLKYDQSCDIRKNYGETYHVSEEWLTPIHRVWVVDNGTTNYWSGILQISILAFLLYMTAMGYYALDEKYCWKIMSPKIRPFENLWEEQGGNVMVPKEQRPWYNNRILVCSEKQGLLGYN